MADAMTYVHVITVTIIFMNANLTKFLKKVSEMLILNW